MPDVDFHHLPKYQPRAFVPNDADLQNADAVADLFAALIERDISSREEFERWVLDCSELSSAVDQAGAILYIYMTCRTLDAQCAEDYKNFIQDVIPAVKPLGDELNQKFLRLNQVFPLDANRYRVFERNIKADVELYCSENVPLETDIRLLAQEYQSIFGAMTVNFQDREYTLPAMARFQLETDRGLREETWCLTARRCQQDAARLEQIFETMLALRDTASRNAGFANFADYQFQAYHRFDYRPEHCKRYHDAARQCVVPVWERILEKRRQKLGVETLRPWDIAVDPLGRNALKPFSQVEDLISGVQKIFTQIDPELGGQFQHMAENGLLDLESRKGKAPGGYQNTLAEARQPFIFMNAVGLDADVRTLLHEGGHAFHALACAAEPVHSYRQAPMEFCEVASMSMELLGNRFLDVFYNEEDRERSIRNHLESVIHILAWVANIDAFQLWMYEYPQHSRQERGIKWLELHKMFNGTATDWSGLEEHRASLWHRQLHIFEVPFYYIEYAIAQLGALQIWQNAKTDPAAALDRYKQALALGGSRTLPELFATAGIEFDFSEKTIAPLVEGVVEELGI